MTWALLWLFYLASFLHLSLSLSLSRRKSDIIKQKGPKKKKRDQREMLFFFRLSFFQQTQKSTKRERGLFEPFVLSNENEGLIIINRQKHRAPLKPLEEEEEDSEDEDGTQTLLETVRVLHRALQSEWFFRFCTGALQQSRLLRAARVLDRHRRIEIRELARVVRGGLSFSFFFSLSCVLFVASLCPFFVVVVVCGFTDDDDDILSLWDAILKRRQRRRKTPFACDDQGSSMSTLDDDDDAPFVVALEQRGDAI